ncbi:MAG TPA: hypothetical protein VL738_03965 [Dactylosporangium sp.]|jgi:hypothetical protein|nr:hypothetical protein [Dactylosporangium sp.]
MNDTDPDVGRIWTAMLDADSEPPLPSATDAISRARRSVAPLALGATLVAAAVVAAVALRPDAPAPQVAAPTVATATSAAPPPLPAAPSREAAHAHGSRTAKFLVGLAPAGLRAWPQDLSADESVASTWQLENGPEYVSTVDVVLTDGTADGLLSATIHGGLAGAGTDPCAPAIRKLLAVTACEVTTVGGVPVGLASVQDPDRGRVDTAVRLLDGGLLTVESAQRIPRHDSDGDAPPDAVPQATAAPHTILGGRPGLPAPAFTGAQLAVIVLDPALLP